MSIPRKKLHLNTVSVKLNCGCTRPRLSLFFRSLKPKPETFRKHKHYKNSASSTSWSKEDDSSTTTTATTSSSSYDVVSPNGSRTVRGFGRAGGEGLAVEKDSDDPYLDFRQSMLQMILENEIYSKDDLRELLNCFLQLNSPCHHGIIVRAFTEIWDGVFSVKSAVGSKKAHHQRYAYKSHEY